MRKLLRMNRRGFTLAESLLAVSIGITFLASSLSAWYYTTKNWKEENYRSELRYNIEKSMEKIKEDIRLSNGNGILFYPSSSSSFTAISIPRANANASGFYTFSSSSISWNDTVVYHIYNNELRRSVFPYNSASATRQSQLDAIAASGTHASATTKELFSSETVSFSITPSSPTFDGYSSSIDQSGNTSFGTVQLAAGNHTIRFEVTGKNSSSSGYRMGIDKVVLTPSGGSQEAEGLTVSADSGRTQTIEDMTAYSAAGLWSGNHQLEYASAGVGDYITFQTYYDQWLECNFENMTHSNTEVSGTDPTLTIMSRENQGLTSIWRAGAQTSADTADNPTNLNNKTVRNLIKAANYLGSGQMVRVKFMASSTGALIIDSAHFGASAAGDYNFSGGSTQLYFGNATVAPAGIDGVGATGTTGSTSITIPAGHYVWSNWMSVTTTVGSDYLVSAVFDTSGANGQTSFWDAGSGNHSYYIDGSTPTAAWTGAEPGFTASTAVAAVSDIAVWTNIGTATSQVYDTHIAAPAYSQMTWNTNGSGTYLVKARSSNDSQMTGATAWSAIAGSAGSPLSLASAGTGRYIQFQVTMTTASPYTTYPQFDEATLQWPGQTALVEISGEYTKRPNYGTFTVKVDGATIVNALEIELEAQKTYQGKTETVSLAAEVKPKNTGK